MDKHAERGAAGQAVAAPRAPTPPGALLDPASRVSRQTPESRRASVRDALDTALNGAALCSRDRQFLSRLVKWDKRNAAAVVSLLWRARLAGRAEVALTERQLEIVLAALSDTAAYRTSGADSLGCWACENVPAGRCAEHAKDMDRASACAELAAALAAGKVTATGLPMPSDTAGYRQVATVAS